MRSDEEKIVQRNKTIRRIRMILWGLLILASLASFFITLGINLFFLAGLFYKAPVLAYLAVAACMLEIGIPIAALITRKKALVRTAAVVLFFPILNLGIILISLAAGWLYF